MRHGVTKVLGRGLGAPARAVDLSMASPMAPPAGHLRHGQAWRMRRSSTHRGHTPDSSVACTQPQQVLSNCGCLNMQVQRWRPELAGCSVAVPLLPGQSIAWASMVQHGLLLNHLNGGPVLPAMEERGSGRQGDEAQHPDMRPSLPLSRGGDLSRLLAAPGASRPGAGLSSGEQGPQGLVVTGRAAAPCRSS